MYTVSIRSLLVVLVVQVLTIGVAALFVAPRLFIVRCWLEQAGKKVLKVVGWSLTAGNESVAWRCMPPRHHGKVFEYTVPFFWCLWYFYRSFVGLARLCFSF